VEGHWCRNRDPWRDDRRVSERADASFQAILVAVGLGKIRFVTFNADFIDDRRLITGVYTSEEADEEDQAD
jgi:hypothetical protein